MRTRRPRVLATAAVLIAGITLAACGDDSDGGGDASDNAITITASEYAFAIDGEATGGYVQVNFQNDGEEPHILVPFKLQDGKTSADALPLLSSEEEPDPEALAEVFDGDPFTSFWGTPGLLAAGDAADDRRELSYGQLRARVLPASAGRAATRRTRHGRRPDGR